MQQSGSAHRPSWASCPPGGPSSCRLVRCSPDNTAEWQVCHGYMGTELLATARMTSSTGERGAEEVIGELEAAG
jgi:hypothetical protein